MNSSVSRHSTVSAAPENEVVACDLNNEVVLLHLNSGTYYSLDAVGASIWKLLDEPRPFEQIHHALLGIYEVEAERCAADLLRVLDEMSQAGLVVVASSTAHAA